MRALARYGTNLSLSDPKRQYLILGDPYWERIPEGCRDREAASKRKLVPLAHAFEYSPKGKMTANPEPFKADRSGERVDSGLAGIRRSADWFDAHYGLFTYLRSAGSPAHIKRPRIHGVFFIWGAEFSKLGIW